jgi:hypothetical protein
LHADAWRLPVYAVVLLYLALPCLLSLLCVRLLNALPHGYVNLEFLVIGAAAMFLPRSIVFCLLLADSLADCAYSICYTYQFSVSDLLESSRFLGSLPAVRLAAGCTVAALAVLLCCALSSVRPHPRRRMHASLALVGLAAVLLPIDMLSGQNPLLHEDLSLLSGRVTRSPILTLGVRALYAHRTEQSAIRAQNTPMTSASAQLSSWLGAQPHANARPDLVLIVVESWGQMLDPHLAASLTAPYADAAIAHRYRVSYGAAPFAGLTVPGEARELCHSAIGFGILHAAAQVAEQCLPSRLHAQGYESTAIHGYAGEMFYRAAWYRALGFDRTLFGRDLRALGLPRCGGAFPGVCDGAIANFIGNDLLAAPQQEPRFVYWVTLNSHLPVPARPNLPDDNACSADPALDGSAALCSWYRLVRAVHVSVSQIAAQAKRPTVFVLVGDHAPPFANPRLRSRFSASQVPYVMLTPASLSPRE